MSLEILETLEEIYYCHSLFIAGGPLSKKIKINYKVGSYDPWLHFIHPSDDDLSFRIHNLEFGKDGQCEAAFLHTATQRGKEIIFNGFMNRLHFLGFKRIRGYIEVPIDHYRMGIVANKGRIEELVTAQKMGEIASKIMGPLAAALYFEEQKSQIRQTLSDKV